MKRRRRDETHDEVCEVLQFDLFGKPEVIRPRPRLPVPSNSGRNPFFCDGPTLINFSGGLSSALMVRRVLDAHGGRLPADTHVVFTNTGKERGETLDFVRDCAVTWGVNIVWLERDGGAPVGARFREVEYETASRKGEPFREMIEERRCLPDRSKRFCTIELKIWVARDYMRSCGYTHWTSMVGLRRDEAKRVFGHRARVEDEWDSSYPLFEASIRKPDVNAYWAASPFTLHLAPWEGNCDQCFLKGRKKRERIMRDRPSSTDWWIAQEDFTGARFHAHEPGYRATLEHVRRLPVLQVIDPTEDDDSIPCGCTERRRRSRCTCGKRRGEGHALSCAVVMAKWAA